MYLQHLLNTTKIKVNSSVTVEVHVTDTEGAQNDIGCVNEKKVKDALGSAHI